MDEDFFSYNQPVTGLDPCYTNARECTARCRLDTGTYCIIPTTYEPDQEGEFLLRVFSEKQTIMEYDYYLHRKVQKHLHYLFFKTLLLTNFLNSSVFNCLERMMKTSE